MTFGLQACKRHTQQDSRSICAQRVLRVHLSNKSSRNCRPWGKVMSSSPDSTPIMVFCSSVTPVIRATCRTNQQNVDYHQYAAHGWVEMIGDMIVLNIYWQPGSQRWACAEPLCLRWLGWKAPWAPAGRWAPGVGCCAAREASQTDPTGNTIPTPPVKEKTAQ